MKLRAEFFLIIFLPLFVCAQYKQQKGISDLSGPEKKWAVFHPFAALRVKKITFKALTIIEDVKKTGQLDQYENGGQLDAFRHSFTMALLAQKIPVRKLRKLGKAHEKGNYLDFKKGKNENGERADSLSCEMDLKNNELGFETGKSNKKVSPDSLKNIVIQKIISQKAFVIKRNEKGNYVTCEGKEIILSEWKGKWFIPKCMVN